MNILSEEGARRTSRFNGRKWVGYQQYVKLVRRGSGLYEPYQVRAPADVYRAFSLLSESDRELFYSLSMDVQNRVCGADLMSVGSATSAIVHPREVYKSGILRNASGIIIVHNHPSGDPTPSANDRAITRQLVEIGRLHDIPLYDHVVIGDNRYFSFAETGLL